MSVAALLDNFISASSDMEMEEKLRQAQAFVRDRLEHNPMEPLLIKLAREFTDSQDLSDRLLKLYKVSRNSKKANVLPQRALLHAHLGMILLIVSYLAVPALEGKHKGWRQRYAGLAQIIRAWSLAPS